MRLLKMLRISATVTILLAIYNLGHASETEQQDATDQQDIAYQDDDNYLAEVRKEVINNKKSNPGIIQTEENDLLNEEERKALSKGAVGDIGGGLKKFKPALDKPKLTAPSPSAAPK